MLRPNEGLPMSLTWMLAVIAGISVANLYYCQPLLNLIRDDMGISEFYVNLMPVLTQVGYALGLLLIIPMGDMYNRRTTVLLSLAVLVMSLVCVSMSVNVYMLLAASFVTGFCSVTPQVFIPFVALYAKPDQKERKVGFILSGLLVGILASRVVSGYVGHVLGWRSMFVIASALMALSAVVVFRMFPNVNPTFQGRFVDLMASIRKLMSTYPLAVTYSVRSAFAFGSLLGMWGCLAFRMADEPYCVSSDVIGRLGICGIAGALTASNVGKYVPRVGVDRMHVIGLSLMALSWSLLWIFDFSYVGIIAGIVLIDIGMQCIQLSNQSATMKLCPTASSRMNTIYMVTYFIGGSFGTFLIGSMWSLFGWTGTCLSGLAMIAMSALVTSIRKVTC